MTDLKGNIVYVNKKFCEISKYSETELLGQNHKMLNSSFHTTNFFKEMWCAIGKGNIWHNEVKNKAKDGTYYWVDTVVLPIRDKNDKIIQYFSLRMPIDERKHAEEERKEYIKSLEEMLTMTSHKVRKPIASCLGIMSLMENKVPLSQDELLNIVEHLKSSALELDTFTKELTTFIFDMEQKAKQHKKNCA